MTSEEGVEKLAVHWNVGFTVKRVQTVRRPTELSYSEVASQSVLHLAVTTYCAGICAL
jgi:hypothetical protein